MNGKIEWGKWSTGESTNFVYGWDIIVSDDQNKEVYKYSGTATQHNFSFTTTHSGLYTIKIVKRDSFARHGSMAIEPTDWVQD